MPDATALTLAAPVPPHNYVNTFSGNFTVGTDSGNPLGATTIVTLSDGGAGGVFVDATGAPISTLSMPLISNSAAFCYVPTSTGVKTISITNDQGLTNPSPVTYTSDAIPSGTIHPWTVQVSTWLDRESIGAPLARDSGRASVSEVLTLFSELAFSGAAFSLASDTPPTVQMFWASGAGAGQPLVGWQTPLAVETYSDGMLATLRAMVRWDTTGVVPAYYQARFVMVTVDAAGKRHRFLPVLTLHLVSPLDG